MTDGNEVAVYHCQVCNHELKTSDPNEIMEYEELKARGMLLCKKCNSPMRGGGR